MESTNPKSLFAEYVRMIEQFKLPGIDTTAILESGREQLGQKALHQALASMQELADTAYRTQSESLALISRRAAENVEELKVLLQSRK